jgi:hypothetical protein
LRAASGGSSRFRWGALLLAAVLAACAPPDESARSGPATVPPPPPAAALPAPAILGSPEFTRETRAALELIRETDEDLAELVSQSVKGIRSSISSGTSPGSGQVAIAEPSLHAPGHSADAQLAWYASVLVHEAMHVVEAKAGRREDWGTMTPEQRNESERGPRAVQAAVLEALAARFEGPLGREIATERDYVRDMNASKRPPAYCYTDYAHRDW